MSGIPELLTFGVGIDTSAAEEGLAALGASGESTAAGLESSLSGAADGMKDLGKESGKASRGIQGLAAVVSLVDPRLGQVIRSVGTLTRGLTVLKLGLGPAAVAVAALTAAVALYQKEQERAARITEDLSRAASAQETSQNNLAAAYEELNAELSETARKELEVLNIRRQAFAESLPGMQDLIKSATNARLEITKLNDGYMRALQGGASDSFLKTLQDQINEEAQRLRGFETQQREIIDNLAEEVRVREAILEVQEDQERAAKAKRDVEKEEVEQLRAAAELRKIEKDAAVAVLSEEDKLLNTYLEQIEKIRQLGEESGNVAAAERAAAAEKVRYEAELAELQSQQHAEYLDRVEQKRLAEELLTQQILADQEQIRQSIVETFNEAADLYTGVASFVGEIAKAQAADDDAAKARAEKLDKGLSIAGAVIGTIAKTLTNILTGNLLGAFTSAFTGAGAVVSMASAHQGGQLAPDEVQDPRGFTRLVGERDNGSGQILSPEASRRLERGEASAARAVAVPVYQHFGYFYADYVQGAGTPLTNEINRTRDTGRGGY